MAGDFDLANQVFKLERCGVGDDKFWSWCKEPDFNPVSTKCRKLKGSAAQADCLNVVQFKSKTRLEVTENCSFGPGKPNVEFYFQDFEESKFEDVVNYCKFRNSWLWWIILLVIIIAAVVLTTAFWCFWRYYLRRKLRPTARERRKDDALQSRYTSYPVSSTGSFAPGSKLKSLYTIKTSEMSKSGREREVSASRSSPTRPAPSGAISLGSHRSPRQVSAPKLAQNSVR